MESRGYFQTIWEYRVRDEYLARFEQVYATDGAWVRLFSTVPGYLRTELIRDCEHRNRFITIDYWRSRDDFLRMREEAGPEYRALDIETEVFLQSERHLGYFELC